MSCPALLYIGNSQRMVEIGDNSIDFIFAGPPYWTHLKYSQDQEQLGNIKHYDIFHAEISKVWSECYRVLKPGSFLCVHTNNLYEHNGKIIMNGEFIRICRSHGADALLSPVFQCDKSIRIRFSNRLISYI
jgi:modification methylase